MVRGVSGSAGPQISWGTSSLCFSSRDTISSSSSSDGRFSSLMTMGGGEGRGGGEGMTVGEGRATLGGAAKVGGAAGGAAGTAGGDGCCCCCDGGGGGREGVGLMMTKTGDG